MPQALSTISLLAESGVAISSMTTRILTISLNALKRFWKQSRTGCYANTTFQIKVAGSYSTNSKLSAADTALLFLPSILKGGIPHREISSPRLLHAARKHNPMRLPTGKRGYPHPEYGQYKMRGLQRREQRKILRCFSM